MPHSVGKTVFIQNTAVFFANIMRFYPDFLI